MILCTCICGNREGLFFYAAATFAFCKLADGFNWMVRIDSLNILQVGFRLDMESPDLGNLV